MSTPSAQVRPVRGQITLRYWAAARAATGVAEEQVQVEGPLTLAELVAGALARHGGADHLGRVIASCSVLLGDRPVASADPATVLVEPGQTVEFLPPFAGG